MDVQMQKKQQQRVNITANRGEHTYSLMLYHQQHATTKRNKLT